MKNGIRNGTAKSNETMHVMMTTACGSNEARVVCRQLGCNDGGENSYFADLNMFCIGSHLSELFKHQSLWRSSSNLLTI